MRLLGLVLAGGQSSRMKTDKALLTLEGKTLLDRAIVLLEDCGCEQVYVSGDRRGYLSIPDRIPDAGPLAGIYSFCRYYLENFPQSETLVIVLPVDMPHLTREVILPLVKSYGQKSSELAVHFNGEVFPLLLKVGKNLFNAIEKLVDSNSGKHHLSIRNLLDSLDSTAIPIEPAMLWKLANINSPDDWKQVKNRFF